MASWLHMGRFCATVLPCCRDCGKAFTLAGVRFGGHQMLPMFLLLTVFAMPVALVAMAIFVLWKERRSVY